MPCLAAKWGHFINTIQDDCRSNINIECLYRQLLLWQRTCPAEYPTYPTRPDSFGCWSSGTLVHEKQRSSHAARSGHFSDTHWGFVHGSRWLSGPFDGRSSMLPDFLQYFWRTRWNRCQATRYLHSHGRTGGGLSGVYKDVIKSSLSETLGHSGQYLFAFDSGQPRHGLSLALLSAVSHRVSLHRRSVSRFQDPGNAWMN